MKFLDNKNNLAQIKLAYVRPILLILQSDVYFEKTNSKQNNCRDEIDRKVTLANKIVFMEEYTS